MQPGAKPFVGRDRELASLEQGLESARNGRGVVFVLSGEPGIGKTRLADELAARAAAAGVRVHWGRCWETGPAPAYWPWTQVLRELATAADPALAPLLEGSVPAALTSTTEVESARFRLHDSVFRALQAATANAPLVVVLDDLHAADHDSLSLLLFVARNARALKLLLVCTTRDAEVAARPSVESLLMRVGREGTRLALHRLSLENVAQLIRQLSPAPVSDAAIAAVFRSSDGTPLYVDEAVRLFEARGIEAVERLSTEATAREVLDAHLSLIPEAARGVLAAAAAIGREFTVSQLARVLKLTEPELARALAAAEKARVIAPAGAGHFRFAHVLLQQALYDRLEAPQRSALHAQISHALENEQPLSIAAHHALRALPGADLDWALGLVDRATQEAQSRLADDTAADLFLRARQALPESDLARRLELLLNEAASRTRMGAGAEGRQLALEAIALARRSNDPVGLARAALTLGADFQIAVVSKELIAVLDEAQQALAGTEHKGLLAQLLARHAAALQPARDPSGPVQMAHRALALARETQDADVLQRTLYSACSAFGDYEEPDVRAPLNREFIDLAQRRGDRVLAHRGLTRLAIDLVELGRLRDCEQVLVELETLAAQARVPQVQWRVPLVRSMLSAAEGRFDACDALLAEARALGASLDDWNVKVTCMVHEFALALVSERELPPALVATMVSQFPGSPTERQQYTRAAYAAVAAREGDVARVKEIVGGIGEGLGALAWDVTAAMWLAGAAHLSGASALAKALATQLDTRRLEYASTGAMGCTWNGPLDSVRSHVAAAQGQLAEAEAYAASAVKKLRALEAPGLLARALFELARVRVERGASGASLPELDEAQALAESLGQSVLIPQLIALRGGAPAPQPQVSLPEAAFTLAREGETWAVRHAEKLFHLKDSRGLQMLDVLIRAPGQEFHALDLSGSSGADAGDAGELLDDTARARYRSRAADLREALEEAEAHHDTGRTARLRAELEFLEDELKRAFGLAGRARRSASAAERARVNVQRRIKDVLKKIEENDPVLGQHLAWAVKTGTFCSYRRSGS